MDEHHSLYFSYYYDGQNSIWCTQYSPVLANGCIHVEFGRRIYFHYLVCWKDLQNRYPAVWKKSYLEGNDQMDIQKKLGFNV